MRTAALSARLAALAGVCAVGAAAAIAAASVAADAQAATALAGSVVAVAADNPGVGAVSGTKSKTIDVWMAGDQHAAEQYAQAVSTPGSASYQRFLSPTAYTQRFGSSPAQVKAVESYLSGAGFTRVQTSVNDDYVSATASVSTINRAFSVQMRRFRVAAADGKQAMIESNDRDLSVPASISSDTLAVTGLNTTEPQADDTAGAGAGGSTSTTPASSGSGAKAATCSAYWGQKTQTISPAFRGLTEAAVGVCGYSAKQVRAAYGLSAANTGKGKTIAIIQVGAPDTKMFQTLIEYARANGLPAPRRGQYREKAIGRGGRACVNGALEEAVIDSEAAYAMAPGANQLMVDGDSCDEHYAQALFNAMLAPLTGKGSRASVAIESVSYGLPTTNENTTPPSQLKTFHAIALRAAAEGVSMLVSSGDAPGIEPPASDPNVTAIGGTTLGIGAHNRRVFETGWSTAFGERTGTSGAWQDKGILVAASGGVSIAYGEPSYQQGVVPASMARTRAGQPGRTVPDFSADADPATEMLFGFIITHPNGKTTPYTPYVNAGTSMATPLIAGIVADAEQGQPKNLGFLNPLLYSLAGSQAYHDALPLTPSDPQVIRAFYTRGLTENNHKFARGLLVGVNDAQDPSRTEQVTAPGYDTMTGLGMADL